MGRVAASVSSNGVLFRPDWRDFGRKLVFAAEEGEGFEVVGVGEEVVGFDGFEVVGGGHEEGKVAREGGGVAGDV